MLDTRVDLLQRADPRSHQVSGRDAELLLPVVRVAAKEHPAGRLGERREWCDAVPLRLDTALRDGHVVSSKRPLHAEPDPRNVAEARRVVGAGNANLVGDSLAR